MIESGIDLNNLNDKVSENIKPEALPFEFEDLESAEQYLKWRESVPAAFRRLIESKIKGGNIDSAAQTGLPLTDQFLTALSGKFGLSVDESSFDTRIRKMIARLDKAKTEVGYIDPFEYLTDRNVSWQNKIDIYNTQFKSILEWLAAKDIEEISKGIEGKDDKKEKGNNDAENHNREKNGDASPDDEEATSSMESGVEKGEGEPKAHFTVHPFWGGYYGKNVLHQFNHLTGNGLRKIWNYRRQKAQK